MITAARWLDAGRTPAAARLALSSPLGNVWIREQFLTGDYELLEDGMLVGDQVAREDVRTVTMTMEDARVNERV